VVGNKDGDDNEDKGENKDGVMVQGFWWKSRRGCLTERWVSLYPLGSRVEDLLKYRTLNLDRPRELSEYQNWRIKKNKYQFKIGKSCRAAVASHRVRQVRSTSGASARSPVPSDVGGIAYHWRVG
jgi:hypothetical protein